MKFKITDTVGTVKEVSNQVEEDSALIDKVVSDIVSPYSRDLDAYVEMISATLRNGEVKPTDSELEDFCINLSTLLYFISGRCENLGIRDDVSKAIWKEVYNKARNDGSGTVADKNSFAELQAQKEQLTNICYSRAYKVLKAKTEAAQELLSSCKKVLSNRMKEYELTHIAVNR